jgi:hypothetical protein
MVREITSPPRPASPGSTSDVETFHPLVELTPQSNEVPARVPTATGAYPCRTGGTGPGGIQTHWFGVDPINEQAYRAYEALGREQAADPVVSGDAAADLVAPWRTPRRATLYARRGTDLSAAGLTPSDAPGSTLTLVLPDDPGVWPTSKSPVLLEMRGHGDVARANAFQVLYDLSRSPGPDAGEALEAWRSWLIESDVVL